MIGAQLLTAKVLVCTLDRATVITSKLPTKLISNPFSQQMFWLVIAGKAML